jgi:hypothetical protein
VIDVSVEVVLKIILTYKINQAEFAAIHVAISKLCQIKPN